MSLYKRGDIWWSRIEVNKRVYQFSTKQTDKNKARTVEAHKRTEKVSVVGLSVPTLREFAPDWFNRGVLGHVARQTAFRYYAVHMVPLVNSELGEVRLDRINRAEIDKFIQWRRKQKVSVTTVNHNLRTLRRMMHIAVEWNLIAKPPKIRPLPGERQREYVLADADVTRFAAQDGAMAKLVPFLVDTGLRRGEVCNLLWPNVSANEIHITKGKTKFARRRIPLTARAKKILADLPRKIGDRQLEHVFTDRYGNGISADWISHAFKDAREKLELPAECVLHSTRHTFCTRLGEKGASAFDIQRLAGHSDIKISMRYVHTSAERLDATIALLN